jgi:mitochondrial fission protein ELM1
MLPTSTWAIAEGYAGLQAQALGLAEAAGLVPEVRTLRPLQPWRSIAPAWWPAPLSAVAPEALAPPLPELLIGCGGKAAAVLAALRRMARAVIVQHPRMNPCRFDLIVAPRHDGLTGPNVLVTRTAIHRASPARLAEAGAVWAPRLAHLPRPLVAVLVGGSNGRYRLDEAAGRALAKQFAGMMRADRVGLMLTPSRRTDPAVTMFLAERLRPLGAFVWDGEGENPYFGMLAHADAIVATIDSMSMLSEAAATGAPLLLATLPGRSRRQGEFLRALIADGRARPYRGRFEHWPVSPIDDTPEAAAEMCRRLGY